MKSKTGYYYNNIDKIIIENGKKFVEDKNGLISILAVLEKSITLENVEGAPFLRNVAAGLLLNFLIDRPSLHTEV